MIPKTTPKKPRKSVGKENTGKDFEKLLEAVFQGYETRGIARIQKVDPPVRIVGPFGRKRVIFLENPWLDYAGSWTEAGGRMLIIEAKSTEEPSLELGDGGITKRQTDELTKWDRYGALTGIVWHHRGDVRVITAATLRVALAMGLKSFKWQHLPPVPKGEGWVLWDVLGALSASA